MEAMIDVLLNADISNERVNEIVAVTLAIIGGLGSFMQGCRNGDLKRTFFNFFTELILAVIAGLAILNLGQWQEWQPGLINALILILTNNGGDTLATAKAMLANFIKRKLNLGEIQ